MHGSQGSKEKGVWYKIGKNKEKEATPCRQHQKAPPFITGDYLCVEGGVGEDWRSYRFPLGAGGVKRGGLGWTNTS